MDPSSVMNPAVGMVLTWLPFALYVLVLYFFLLRPLRRLSASVERLADAIEKKAD